MAEVFLAMQEGIGGFEKLVVIKRIFRQFCEDENFVRMFLDEARLAASIRHQNVVQILDIQRDEEGFFIVMEYLSGESTAYLFEALRARGERLPPYIACRIAAEIAAGLHHAHTATDAAGTPQPIVHRDVTPSNLIVSFNGVVKVVDFGVAKATLGEGYTQAGALKGKMSYLAPEQVEDLPVDGRTDIFQLGICLHEMLTGVRLFTGESDHQKMLAVMEKEIAVPSSIAPDVPPELDRVALWALERNPDRRPQNADTLRRELEKVLKESGQIVSDHDVGEWMHTSFGQRHADRRAMERECVSEMREGRSNSLGTSPHPTVVLGHGTHAGTRAGTPTMATVLHRKQTSSSGTGSLTPRQGWLVASVLATCMAAVGIGLWYLGGEEPADAAALNEPRGAEKAARSAKSARGAEGSSVIATANAAVTSTPPAQQQAQAQIQTQTPAASATPASVPGTPGAADQTDAATGAAGSAERAEPVVVMEHPPTAPTVAVKVRTLPADASIFVDGAPQPRGALELQISRGVEHRLVVQADGYRPYQQLISEGSLPPELIKLKPLKRQRKRVVKHGGQEDRTEGDRVAPPTVGDADDDSEGDKSDRRRWRKARPTTGNLDPWRD